MNKKIISMNLSALALLIVSFFGCDLIDPTEVENPAITEDKLFEDASGGAEPLITGLQYAFAEAVRKTAVYTECVSDNYDNTYTFLSNVFDSPREISPSEQYLGDRREIYFKLQELRALADFGLSVVLPKDDLSTQAQEAETRFFKGMGLLMLSENFQAFPTEDQGPAVRSQDAVLEAIAEFKAAIELDPQFENEARCRLALARAYRLAEDKTNAVIEANAALGLSGDYVYYANYDPINLTNHMNLYSVRRSSNDIQPLPRLDFLEPKYPQLDDPIAVLKSEEAYMILAEAAISDGAYGIAQNHMVDLLNLAKNRTKVTFSDNDPREDRPSGDSVLVKFDETALPVAGLIKTRSGASVEVSPISNTSVLETEINTLTTKEEFYAKLYLMRQEIFFSEGRRMSDLGIRLPVMQRQIDMNGTINPGDYGTVVYVPAYIPAEDQLDSFIYDEAAGVTTIMFDMNKILAQNLSEAFPFE